MRLIVKNLGVIKYADIDLSKDLTMFCGPNGTGKTYIAYLLNSLYNTWGRNFAEVSQTSIDEYLTSGKVSIKKEHLDSWTAKVAASTIDEIPSIFGITRSESEKLFKNPQVTLLTDDSDLDRIKDSKIKYKLYLGSKKILSFDKDSGEMTFRFQHVDEDVVKHPDDKNNYISLILASIFKRALLSPYSSRMLTVERNSIYTFKTELTSNRFEAVDQVLISDNGDAETIVRSRTSLYPLAVRNSLSVATDLENIIKRESEYIKFAKEIEQDLLSGKVAVGKEGDVQFIPSTDDEAESAILPIRMSSSAVKTLSGLVIYLKHLAHKGDVLIVDEPEMNLHPDNQRRLARIFARMVNKGIHLVISTHSDYIVREFNNMVMAESLSSGKPEILETLGYTTEELIDKKHMQSYLFNFDKEDNVTVSSIGIDDYGFEVLTIDDTIAAQNEATITLRDTLDECRP